MKILLALLALGIIVIAAIIIMIKRSAGNAKPDTDIAIKPLKPRMVAPKLEPSQSNIADSPAEVSLPIQTETIVQPEASLFELELASQLEQVPVVESKIDVTTKIQSLGSVSYSQAGLKAVTIPEDSVLRRHFLSTRQAEKLAISNPYPTDFTLRRHYESILKLLLKTPSTVVLEIVSAEQSSNKLTIPEDSVLRRHYLTQLQAELSSTDQ